MYIKVVRKDGRRKEMSLYLDMTVLVQFIFLQKAFTVKVRWLS